MSLPEDCSLLIHGTHQTQQAHLRHHSMCALVWRSVQYAVGRKHSGWHPGASIPPKSLDQITPAAGPSPPLIFPSRSSSVFSVPPLPLEVGSHPPLPFPNAEEQKATV